MAAEIGATLREARMRGRIDVSEIEAKTKIRAKYLRALENEEWDLLPGPTFVKSFLRTYATALELDGKALVEEYRLHYERPSEPPEPIVAGPRKVPGVPRGPSRGPARPGPSRGYMALVGIVGVVIVLLIVGLLSGGNGGSSPNTTNTTSRDRAGHGRTRPGAVHRPRTPGTSDLASLKLEPTGEVYVCLIGDDASRRIPGVILKPGAHEPIYHAHRFLLTLGNNAVSLIVNGTPQTVPASAQAIGYSITRSGIKPLAAGELPTCT
jgi:cytoskeleton protein RodZ